MEKEFNSCDKYYSIDADAYDSFEVLGISGKTAFIRWFNGIESTIRVSKILDAESNESRKH